MHLSFGIFAAEGGYELTLVLAASAVTLVLAGAGRLSADAALTQRRAA
ncbi:hypothetical protein [Cryobacterium adonitolivorans]|nr:hypothetical protein [Cryobacterium adonitolivorans]